MKKMMGLHKLGWMVIPVLAVTLAILAAHPSPPERSRIARPKHLAKRHLEHLTSRLLASQVANKPEANPAVCEGPDGSADTASPANHDDDSIDSMAIAELKGHLGALMAHDLHGNSARRLIRRWIHADPAAAAQWAALVADDEISTTVALLWSEQDLAGALSWARSQPGDDLRVRLLTELGYELARADAVAAMTLAAELPASDASDNLWLHALRQWTAQAPELSQAWVLKLPPSSLREKGMSAVVTVLASQDGGAAARLAAEQIPPGPDQDRAVIEIVQRWTQQNAPETLAWIDSFPPSPIRDQALKTIVGMGSL